MEVQDLIMWTLLFTCAVYIVSIETKYVLELDDVNAAVNEKFVYTIGDQKFSQTYKIHRIVERKTKSLPDWLSFDNATNILYGTPTSEDIGTYPIRMKATCIDPPNMECQEKISRSFQIRIVEPIKSAESRGRDDYRLHAWSEKHHGKYSLNLTSSFVTSDSLKDPNSIWMHDFFDHPYSLSLYTPFQTSDQVHRASYSFINSVKVNPCDNGIPSFYASLILNVKHDISTSVLYSNILSFADFVSKPLHLISLKNSSSDILSMQMDNKHIITAGPGNVVASLKESMELSWHVGCGEFLHVEEFGKVLQHNIDVGRISKELDTDVIAWILYSDQSVSQRRKREANLRFRRTKTPTFSLIPSTTISEFSHVFFTELQSSESLSSLISPSSILFPNSSTLETSGSGSSTETFDISSFIVPRSSIFPISPTISHTLASFSDKSLFLPESSFTFTDILSFPLFTSEENINSRSGSVIKATIISSFSSFGLEVESSSFSRTSTLDSSFHVERSSTSELFTDIFNFSDSVIFSSEGQLFSSASISTLELSLLRSTSSSEDSTLIVDSTLISIPVVSDNSTITRSSLFGFPSSITPVSSLSLSSVFEKSILISFPPMESEITTGSKIIASSTLDQLTSFLSSSTFIDTKTKPETTPSQFISELLSTSTAVSNLLKSSQIPLSSVIKESSRPSISSFDIMSSTLYMSLVLSDLISPDSFSVLEESVISDFNTSYISPSFLSIFETSSTVSSQIEVRSFSTGISSLDKTSMKVSSSFSQSGLVKSSSFLSEIFETSFETFSVIGSNFSEYDSLFSFKAYDASILSSNQSSEIDFTTDLSQVPFPASEFSTYNSAESQVTLSAIDSFESDDFLKTSFISQTSDTSAFPSTESSLFVTSIYILPETSSKLGFSSISTVLQQYTLSIVSPISSVGPLDATFFSSFDFSSSISETLIVTETLIPTRTRPLFSTEAEILGTPSSSLDTMLTRMTPTSTVKETLSFSQVLMSSIPGVPSVPIDDPPFRQNSIDHLTIVFDKFFTYTIPANTFNDTEDGNTRNLTLSISLLYGKPIPIGAWLKFNSTSQTVYGIPLQQDIKNEDKFVERFVLKATDSQGQATRDVISLSYRIEVLAITHSISLELDVDFDDFHLERQNLVNVAEMLASLYGNPNLKFLTFFDVRKGSVIVRWGNNSLFGSICYKDIINDVYSRVAFNNGTLTAELEDVMSHFNPVSAKLELTGPCLLPQLTPLPPFDSPVGASDNDRMWIEILLPALVVILILVIIALVLLICCRHRKPSKEPQSDKPTFLEDRRPIIFPEELEMVDPSLKPKQPLILPRDYLTETPPALPPHGLQDPPSYRVPEINEDMFRPGSSQTPPPPNYGNQSTSEPPPYRLPPPYYNPHRANIKS